MFFLQNLFYCIVFLNAFLLFSHTLKKKAVCFSRVQSLWVQGPLFVPIITHFQFRMRVGSKIPISHSHKQMMTRLLPRAVAERKTKPKTRRRVPRSPGHQTGLLAEANGPLSGCPRRRPSLGR